MSGDATTAYIRSDELEADEPVGVKSWLWPWGVAGLIGFLALTGFFMVLLRPASTPPGPPSVQSQPLVVAAPLPPGSAQAQKQAVPASADAPPPDGEMTPMKSIFDMYPKKPVSAAADETPPSVESSAAAPPVPASPVTPVAEASPPALSGKGPWLGIMVMDLGDAAVTRAALDSLPPEVDLGFSPGASPALVKEAIAKGHRIWMGIPMQPRRYPQINPGPLTLLVGPGAAGNAAKLDKLLANLPEGASGVYNIMGSAFTADKAALAPLMDQLSARKLAFFDTRSGSDTVAAKTARAKGLAAALNGAFLEDAPDALAKRLEGLAGTARRDGAAVAVVPPDAAAIRSVSSWLKSVPPGVSLVRVRDLAATPSAQKL